MTQRLFFWIAAIIGALLGLLMFFAPGFAAQSFNVTSTPLADALFRVLGAALLAVALMNFLVRDHPVSPTLLAILWMNAAVHILGLIADVWSTSLGALTWTSILLGSAIHVVLGAWALYLIFRPARA
jgi:hypothetical protein